MVMTTLSALLRFPRPLPFLRAWYSGGQKASSNCLKCSTFLLIYAWKSQMLNSIVGSKPTRARQRACEAWRQTSLIPVFCLQKANRKPASHEVLNPAESSEKVKSIPTTTTARVILNLSVRPSLKEHAYESGTLKHPHGPIGRN
jgi:hypothetical protein